MIVASLGAAIWLLVSHQADTVDGLFMVLTSLLVAASFGLYVKYMIRRVLEAQSKPAAKAAAAVARSAAKPEAEAVTK